jgi:hypothetical protein
LNFDTIPSLSPNCLSLSSLFWIFVSHPSTNQAWPCLASETRWDWRSFLIGHFLSLLWVFVLSWILLGWLVLVPRGGWE